MTAIVQSAEAFLKANADHGRSETACTYIAGLLDEIDRLRAERDAAQANVDNNYAMLMAERERCAKIAEEADHDPNAREIFQGVEIAAAIRKAES